MKKHSHITGFYLETLLLIAVFIAIILVLTHVFGLGRALSGEAEILTNAVCLAENAAEAVAASDSPEALLALLDEGGSARAENGGVTAGYDRDMNPVSGGELQVGVTWEQSGDLVNSTVTVTRSGAAEPVYTLHTAVYLGEVSP